MTAAPPTGWRTVTLPDLIGDDGVFVDGDWVESKDQDPDGEVRLIQLADVGEGEFIDKSARFLTAAKAKALKCTDLKAGDILVARMPDPLGRACVFPGLDQRCVTVVDVCIVRPDPRLVDPAFLCRAINSSTFRRGIDKFTTGTTRQRISRGNLSKVAFPLPPLAEQKRIAAVLDKADDLRAKRRHALATLDTLLQSVFLDMFGDPVTNPKGWPVQPLASVCPIAGEYGSGAAAGEFQTGLPRYIRITDIDEDGRLRGDPVAPDCPELDWRDYLLSDGDLLFARSGATVGKTYLYTDADGFAVFAGYLIRFRPDASRLLPTYLYHFTRTGWYAGWVQGKQRVVAQPNINATQYGELPVPIPPIGLQRAFVDRICTIGVRRGEMIRSRSFVDSLFASLQSAAFAGSLFDGTHARTTAPARSHIAAV